MRQWTTPTHKFEDIGIDLRDAEAVYLTYEQRGTTVLEKSKEEIEISENGISVTLSQEETGAFKADADVSMQIRYRLPDGRADASEIAVLTVERTMKGGVI